MEVTTTVTSISGTYPTPFVSGHGYSQPCYTVTIDAANLVAADLADGAFPSFLPAGFPLGQLTADDTYAKYDDLNADGTETLRGVLRDDLRIDSATSVVQGVMVTHAVVSEALLPVAIDAAGKADLPTLGFVD